MKRSRYSVLFSLFHLLLATLLISHQQQRIWSDLKNVVPVGESDAEETVQSDFAWGPCYEYRPTVADHFVLGVQFPAGLLLGLDGSFRGCNPGLLSPLFRKLRMGAKTGTILLDVLLALCIMGQWWLIGWRIDTLCSEHKSPSLWLRPALVISVAGLLMMPAGFGAGNSLELIAALATIAALLTWIVLLTLGLGVVIKPILKA